MYNYVLENREVKKQVIDSGLYNQSYFTLLFI